MRGGSRFNDAVALLLIRFVQIIDDEFHIVGRNLNVTTWLFDLVPAGVSSHLAGQHPARFQQDQTIPPFIGIIAVLLLAAHDPDRQADQGDEETGPQRAATAGCTFRQHGKNLLEVK